MSRLEANHINKSYRELKVLKDVTIRAEENEIISLLGVSGVGKTTLFHIISGLTIPDRGNIFLNGEDVTGIPGHISYMLQKDLLLPYRTIVDNVSLPLVIKGMKKKEARAKVKEYFEDFGLSGTEKKYPSQLSGGMRQRAALLRTYMFSEGVVLLDEPFSALDAVTKNHMHIWYLEMMEHMPLTTILITHDIDEAILLSDRIYLLKGQPGRITNEIPIEGNKPRGGEFQLTEEFLAIKRKILQDLR